MSELCVKIPRLDYGARPSFQRQPFARFAKNTGELWFSQRLVGPCVATPRLAGGHHPLTHEKDYPMKRHIQLKTIISLLSLLIAFSGAAFGQEITGVLTGTVKDANGAGVKGAAVTVTDSAKKLVVRTTSTDDDGAFTVTDLHVGVY